MAIGTGAALLGGAALGGLTGIIGANKSAGAIKDASQDSAAVQQYMFNQSAAMQQPWMQTGASALAQLAGLYGLSPVNYMGAQQGGAQGAMAPQGNSTGLGRRGLMTPEVDPRIFPQGGASSGYQLIPGSENYMGMTPYDNPGAVSDVGQYAGMTPGGFAGAVPTQDAAMAAFQTSPGYQFRMDEAMKALGGMASATGTRGHGATMEDIMRYSQGLASEEYGNYTNRLAALAGVGQTSAANMGANALTTGQGIANAYTNAGNARASGILGVANTLGNTMNNAAWMYGMYGGGGAAPSGGLPWNTGGFGG
jgi:hypothetical protein